MESWIFTGVSDKNDFLMYVCQLLATEGCKLLLVDGTDRQIYRYSVGQTGNVLPITEFCGFDVACGFFSAASLKQYLEEHDTSVEQYDLVLYDLEKMTFCDEEEWKMAKGVYWTSSLDRFSIERSSEWFQLLFSKYPGLHGMKLGLIINRYVDCQIDENYLQSLMENLPLQWNEQAIKFPWDEKNYSVQLENDHNRSLKVKSLSKGFRKSIRLLAQQLSGEKDVKRRSILRSSIRGRAWANI